MLLDKKNNTILAFISVAIVWSTTPLAIKLSAIGSSPIFSITARTIIAVVICYLLLYFKNQKLDFKKYYVKYSWAGIGIFVTLILVYMATKHVESGIVAIMFGLIPIFNGVFSNILLKNNEFRYDKLILALVCLAGVIVIFYGSANISDSWAYMLLLLFSSIFQSFTTVKLKAININTSSLQTTTGGLLVSLPFFLISFYIMESGVIPEITSISIISIMYLSIFASVIAFIGYYYLITNTSVLIIGIIPLLSPIFSLFMGNVLLDEVITNTQILGIVIVLMSLIYDNFLRSK